MIKCLGGSIRCLCVACLVPVDVLSADPVTMGGSESDLPEFVVVENRVANTDPGATYEQAVSRLRFDPQVDLQTRNLGEAQGDISVRGGIFENSGFRVGAATLVDPQTGHYAAEIPISPRMMGPPKIMTGIDNAIAGFNSTVATISHEWNPLEAGHHGSLTLGVGEDSSNRQSLYDSVAGSIGSSPGTSGFDFDLSRSTGDGTLLHGDHVFHRIAGRIRHETTDHDFDIFAGYQSKFFGWPNMYTPFNRNETENLQTRLFMINYRRRFGSGDFFEATGLFRRHSDHYVFDRLNPQTFQAFHETKVWTAAFQGRHTVQRVGLNYNAQFVADRLDSTALVHGEFQSRSYVKATLLPEIRFSSPGGRELRVQTGVSFDATNRDGSAVLPLFGIWWSRPNRGGSIDQTYFEYSEGSQVPGYTAISSNPNGGLFRGNPNLAREQSRTIEGGLLLDRESWSARVAAWYRRDVDALDWTFSFESPFARTANNVDIDIIGLEFVYVKSWSKLDLVLGFTLIRKVEDYASEEIDASFYALNFARHRFTAALSWRPFTNWEVRSDNEIREQEPNSLRGSSHRAFVSYLSVTWNPPWIPNIGLTAAVDNLLDSDYEEIPAVPASRRQVSFSAAYSW